MQSLPCLVILSALLCFSIVQGRTLRLRRQGLFAQYFKTRGLDAKFNSNDLDLGYDPDAKAATVGKKKKNSIFGTGYNNGWNAGGGATGGGFGRGGEVTLLDRQLFSHGKQHALDLDQGSFSSGKKIGLGFLGQDSGISSGTNVNFGGLVSGIATARQRKASGD